MAQHSIVFWQVNPRYMQQPTAVFCSPVLLIYRMYSNASMLLRANYNQALGPSKILTCSISCCLSTSTSISSPMLHLSRFLYRSDMFLQHSTC